MLKLTKKADYGLIALRHLAVARPRASASAKDIADSYGIPLPLLSKVLQKLARGGLLIKGEQLTAAERSFRTAISTARAQLAASWLRRSTCDVSPETRF